MKPPKHRLFRCKGCGGEAGEILEAGPWGAAGSAFHLKPKEDANRRPAACSLFQRLKPEEFVALHRDVPELEGERMTRWESTDDRN